MPSNADAETARDVGATGNANSTQAPNSVGATTTGAATTGAATSSAATSGVAATDEQARRLARLAQRRPESAGTEKSGRSMAWWMRWTHVYVSMISLVVVLFFGITGITLNHQDWSFGTSTKTDTVEGTLPADVFADPDTEFLAASEYFRSNYDVRGNIVDFRNDGSQGTISYAGPGYRAEASFAIPDGTFRLTTENQGWITVLNDLHKGRDTTSSWRWLIDVSGVFLVVVALTGLIIQLYMRKRRTRAIILAVIGTAITIALTWIALT